MSDEATDFENWWAVAGERQIHSDPKGFARSAWLARAARTVEGRLESFLERDGRALHQPSFKVMPHEHGFEEP